LNWNSAKSKRPDLSGQILGFQALRLGLDVLRVATPGS
jgi:hypothetical protein